MYVHVHNTYGVYGIIIYWHGLKQRKEMNGVKGGWASMRMLAVFVRFTRAKKQISKNEQPFCVDLINLLIKFSLCIFRMPSKREDRFKNKKLFDFVSNDFIFTSRRENRFAITS